MASQVDVVVAHDRESIRHGDAGPRRRLEQRDGDGIVGAEHRADLGMCREIGDASVGGRFRWHVGCVRQVQPQAGLGHRLLVAPSPLDDAGERIGRRAHEADVAMAGRDEMLDRGPRAAHVVADDRIEVDILGVGVHQDGRRPFLQQQGGAVAEMRTNDDEPVAHPLGDQARHLQWVVLAVHRHRREQQVDLPDAAHLLDARHDRGVEAVDLGCVTLGCLDDQADRRLVVAATGGGARDTPVAEAPGGRHDAFPGLGAHAGLTADGQRCGRWRDRCRLRHVGERHPLARLAVRGTHVD